LSNDSHLNEEKTLFPLVLDDLVDVVAMVGAEDRAKGKK
jgi:hypothetical protein